MKLSPRVLMCSWIWEVLVLGFFAEVLNVWETVDSRTVGCGIETSGVKSLDDASSSASSSTATFDSSVALLWDSSSGEKLCEACRADVPGRRRFRGGSGGTAGLLAADFCVCLAGLGEVVDPAAMVNGIIKGAGPFDSSEVLSSGAIAVRKITNGLKVSWDLDVWAKMCRHQL